MVEELGFGFLALDAVTLVHHYFLRKQVRTGLGMVVAGKPGLPGGEKFSNKGLASLDSKLGHDECFQDDGVSEVMLVG